MIHPVVRTHPETGADGLFVNYGFTDRIKGLRREESKALLDMLFVHVQKPEYQVRWKWKPNSIAFWDNRVTQHYAVNDYLPNRRVMHRATILGDPAVQPRPQAGGREDRGGVAGGLHDGNGVRVGGFEDVRAEREAAGDGQALESSRCCMAVTAKSR